MADAGAVDTATIAVTVWNNTLISTKITLETLPAVITLALAAQVETVTATQCRA